MKKQSVNIAKITRPDIAHVVHRQRLFQKMRQPERYPLTWVSGPPGSGKTTLVSSFVASSGTPCLWYKVDSSDTNPASFYHYLSLAYQKAGPQECDLPVLTSGYSQGISEFNRSFFTELFRCFDSTFTLVLDNYQDLPENVPFHELLLDTLNFMPETVNLVIISRTEPSAKFSRLRINRRLQHIDWQDLRFSAEEFQDVISQSGFGAMPRNILQSIHNKMQGWIGGLIFLLEGTKKYNTSLSNIGTGTFDEIYQYFKDEVFEYQVSDIQHFLLKISVLPHVTVKQAQAITGKNNSCKILSYLHKNNFFVDKLNGSTRDAYQLNQLFREFLTADLASYFSPEEIIDLKRRAALLLLDNDMEEEAAGLLIKAKDWDGLITVINRQSDVLQNPGRIKLLAQWLDRIPLDVIETNPWLSYWRGKSLQYGEPKKAKSCFAAACAVFCEEQEWAGAFAAWSAQVDTIINAWNDFKELDILIDWLELYFVKQSGNLTADLKLQVSASMVAALNIRRPQSISIAKWLEFAMEEAIHNENDELAMQAYIDVANYYLWCGDQSICWVLLGRIRNLGKSPRVTTLAVLKSKSLEANMYAVLMSDGAKCLETVNQALEIARYTGVHSMDTRLYIIASYGAYLEKDFARMNDYLQTVEKLLDNSNRHNYFGHNYFSAWFSLTRSNTQRGIQHANLAVKTAISSGYIYHQALGLFAKAQILFEKGDFQAANKELSGFQKIIEPLGSMLLQYMYLLSKAQFSSGLGKEEVGIKYLRRAMALGREQNFQNVMCWLNAATMTKLSMLALENNIEVAYVKSLVNSRGLVPATSPIEIEQWPWPIKIYTFGRFEIVKNGKAIRSSGKAKQKPLALLKTLIALGGRSVSDFNLADALWPDAEGDMQHQSLATTLHRLRRILGDKDMVDYQDGNISLNPKYCWVDAWAFERLLSQAETEARKNEKKSSLFAARYAEKAINLYKGNFLPQNNTDHWSIHMRERLKSRFLRGVSFLGRNLEKIDERAKAVEFYQKALETDPLVEEFYQRLMLCYQRMDRIADSVLVFRRCLKNFDKILNITPSSQTKALYNNLIAKQYAPRQKIEMLQKKSNM